MRNIKYQAVRLTIASAGASAEINAQADKLYDKITGIALELPYESNLFGSKIQVTIAHDELFPEDYEAKRLCSSQDVSPNDRFYIGTKDNPLFDDAKGNSITGKLTDGALASGVTYPYTAILTLRLENIEKPRD